MLTADEIRRLREHAREADAAMDAWIAEHSKANGNGDEKETPTKKPPEGGSVEVVDSR